MSLCGVHPDRRRRFPCLCRCRRPAAGAPGIVGEGAGNPAPALLRQVAVVIVLKGGNLVTRVRTCSDPGQLMRIVVLVEISRPASRFAYAPVVELIVTVVLDQRGAAIPPDVDDAVQAVVVIAVVGDGAVDCLRIRVALWV